MTGGGPQAVEFQEVGIDQRDRRRGVADRADTADRITGFLADKLRIRTADLADLRRYLLFVDAIRAARDHQHRRVVLAAAKQNRCRIMSGSYVKEVNLWPTRLSRCGRC